MSIPIQIVDQNDRPVRGATKLNAWQQGLRHRIVRVMIDDGAGNILLQKRLESKETYPGCWDNSAAGHVDEGESYEIAAKRELAEELGLHDVDLTEVAYYETEAKTADGKILNRFNKVYCGTVAATVPVRIQPEEVAEARWMTIEDMKLLVAQLPDTASDGLHEVVARLYS